MKLLAMQNLICVILITGSLAFPGTFQQHENQDRQTAAGGATVTAEAARLTDTVMKVIGTLKYNFVR